MTAYEVLDDILGMYQGKGHWQSDIAEKYRTSTSIISLLLSRCGFYRGKQLKIVLLEEILEDEEIQNILEKLLNQK